MLNKEEISRYSRHLLLPEIGISGQEKLKAAKVLVIGAGGLGCPALQYLAAAGVGEIGIIDFDKVDISNLQRQILYNVEDVGKYKAEISATKLSKQNPLVSFKVFNSALDTKNALQIISDFDIVIDGTDNFTTRYLVNDACVILNKPLIYGSIYRFEGQVSVFNYSSVPNTKSPTYRCLFPVPPSPESSPNCSEIGVLGVLPGIIGTLQATETIKLITGIGEILSGRLLLINALSMEFITVSLEYNKESNKNAPQNRDEFLKTDYPLFCGQAQNTESVKSISASELLLLLKNKDNLQLLDVRENGELPIITELIDLQIPLSEVENGGDKISKDKKVIVFCKSGGRSRKAISLLEKKYNLNNLYNLEGGVLKFLETKQ